MRSYLDFRRWKITFAVDKREKNIMQYWANIGGVQYGPVERENLAELGLSADSYVWRPGLDEWVLAADLEELADLLPPSLNQVVADVAEGDGSESSSQESEQLPPSIPAEIEEEDDHSMASYPRVERVEQPAEEQCPPTNLVWAILSTILCFTIFGIIAIVYAAKVSSRYRIGDIATAKKFSDRAAMWSILSITIGVVTAPIYYIFQLFY